MFKNLNRKKISLILTTIIILILIITTLFSIVNEKKHQNLYENYKYFQIINNYYKLDDKSYSNFMNEIYISDKFKQNLINFHKELSLDKNINNNSINYIEFNKDYFRSIGFYNGKKELVNGFGETKDLSNQKVKINNEEFYLTPFNEIKISDEFQEIFFYNKIFQEKDFILNNKTIPIVLGKDFKTEFKVGDKITFIEGDEFFEGEIISFFDPEVNLRKDSLSDTFKSLDFGKLVILPIFEELDEEYINKNFVNKEFITDYYFSIKTNNYLYVNDIKDFYKAKKYIQKLSKKNNLDYTLIGY